MNHLNLQQIIYFKEIADRGTIAEAASALLISPPALSMQLKALEESMGRKLFDREGKKLVLNSFGAAVLDKAKKVYGLRNDILSLCNSFEKKQSKKISIGLYDGLPKTLSLKVFSYFSRLKDNISLEISENTNQDLKKSLMAGDIDGAFTNLPLYDESGSLKSHEMGKSQISLYGGKKFSSLKKKFPQGLQGAPIILPSVNSDIRYLVENWFSVHNIHYHLVGEVHDSSVKKILAEESLGLVALPDLGARRLVQRKQLTRIGRLEGLTEYYYLTLKRDKSSLAQTMQAFLKYLKAHPFE